MMTSESIHFYRKSEEMCTLTLYNKLSFVSKDYGLKI